MSKRLTYEYVKNYIEFESNSGYKLISSNYINNYTKLKMVCDEKHNCEISFANFQQGKRCNVCKGKNRLSYEYVKNYFNQLGYILLSTEYTNNHTKLQIKCPKGHIFNMPFYVFQNNGSRCPKCAKIKQSQEQLLTYNVVKNFIEVESNSDCKLTSLEYRGNDQKLDIECPCGNQFKTTFKGFKQQNKRKCNKCSLEIRANKKRCKYNDVFNIFKKNNCTLLSTEYSKNYELLHYICECGKEDYISLNNFKSGQRCKDCGELKKAKSLYNNGTVKCSKQQKYIYNLFGGELNYPIGRCNVDVAFPKEKIYVEYDGSGHELSIKLNTLSNEEFNRKEVNRNYYLMRNGWKQIRIISSMDKLPSDSKLMDMLNYAIEYLNNNHHYIIFNIDKNYIKTSQFEQKCDYGNLFVIKKEVA